MPTSIDDSSLSVLLREVARLAGAVGERVRLAVGTRAVRHGEHVAAFATAELGAIGDARARIPSGRRGHGLPQ